MAFSSQPEATLTNILQEMRNLSTGIAEIKTSQDRLVSDNTNIKSSLDTIQSTLPEMRSQLNTHSEQISSFERDRRRKNLVIFGLNEVQGETRSEVEKKICELIGNLLESALTLQEVDFCRRVGKFRQGKNRPVLLGLTTERKKYEIFRNCHKLRGSVISIREDLPDNVRNKRKDLIIEMKKLRAEGKSAYVNYDKLVIRDDNQSQKSNQKRAHSESPSLPNKKTSQAEATISGNHFGFVNNMIMESISSQEPQASQSSTPTAGQRTNVTQSRIERFFPREDVNRKDL
ncbi:hypothetical protein M8J76_001306 [Diaphorina citri]|nr:hypothetical protein M8J75_015916 [Diaphorina citri]KAI5707708.1 hypothetical protein M8J77_008142 [Diaphorina citri]KAI5708694.1 hypothetical protein M8J76_001306 [Diaphorina citri]